jgi:L-alanine-DL-glutamate epimerase-like enolase superfamily enzyme
MRPVLIGENPHAVERIWDKLYRTNVTGRKGETMQALSKVDLALWDLKGKLLGVPAYILLGGPSRERVPAYASMLGYDQAPEHAARASAEVVAQGYRAVKWFLSYTPQDGQQGLRRNLATIRAVREAVGPDVQIMFDAWKSWDVLYTRQMAELAAPYRPWWFEEPVMPDMIHQYAEIRRALAAASIGTAISGGEHEYTRWGAKALLAAGAVDVLQMDVIWAGGLTEMCKVAALASAYGIPLVPHCGYRAASHLIAAQAIATCPLQEWLIQSAAVAEYFLVERYWPENGFLGLPPGPGLAMELDESRIESRELLDLS